MDVPGLMKIPVTQTSLNFDERTNRLLAELKGRYAAPSKTEVLRRALILLDEIRRAQDEGGEILLIDRDKNARRLLMLW